MARTPEEIEDLAKSNAELMEELQKQGLGVNGDPLMATRIEVICEHLGLEETVHLRMRDNLLEIQEKLPELKQRAREQYEQAATRQALLNPGGQMPPPGIFQAGR